MVELVSAKVAAISVSVWMGMRDNNVTQVRILYIYMYCKIPTISVNLMIYVCSMRKFKASFWTFGLTDFCLSMMPYIIYKILDFVVRHYCGHMEVIAAPN